MWILSLILALILVAALQVWFFQRYGFKKLSYKRWFEPSVANEGDPILMYETVRNEKLLPLPWVRIEAQISPNIVFGDMEEDTADERRFQRSIFSLAPYMNITRRHFVKAKKRGYYSIRSVAISTGDLLGLSKRRPRNFETDTLLVVYPTLLPIEDVLADKNSFTGDVVVRRWIVEDPFMIRGVRAYTSSDPYNHINWKATARTGELQVHDFDYTADIKLMIVVNVDTSSTQWSVSLDEKTSERALSMAATVAQYAIDNGIETGFACNGRIVLEDPKEQMFLAPQSGPEHLTAIYESIARILLQRTVNFHTFLQTQAPNIPDNCDILLITAYTDENIDQQIEALRGAGRYVEILNPYGRSEAQA